MRTSGLSFLFFVLLGAGSGVNADPSRHVSRSLFASLDELARIVDISYCVGTSGIHKPFQCLSRCAEFEGFELITTWNTGPLLSDSCGYIALSHSPQPKRVIVAFRGTYSIANTIADLSSYPSEYTPFPSGNDDDDGSVCSSGQEQLPRLLVQNVRRSETKVECPNCTVHAGFMTSWRNTRCIIIPHVETVLRQYPDYELVLVGHSLGGAVAALASLEFKGRGWDPLVTTFGEPRVGNAPLNAYIDKVFNLTHPSQSPENLQFRRVTHINDPIPLLPLAEWDFSMHAGEIFISKASLPFEPADLYHCIGDEDPECIAAEHEVVQQTRGIWSIPPRYRLWELFFAHRDYFLRLGLCVPGGDPSGGIRREDGLEMGW